MRRLVLIAALVLAACAPVAGVEAEAGAGGTATAKLGQTARLGDVTVRPIAVIEDSRCPRDVECVWAGRLRLQAAVSGVRGETELTLRQPFALPSGGTLTLVAAMPERWQTPPAGAPRGPASEFVFRRD